MSSIKELDDRLTTMYNQRSEIVRKYQNIIYQETKELSSEIKEIELRIKFLIAEQFEIEAESIKVSLSMKCPTSPVEVCVYDINDDPCCDYCLYCGEPLERK